ncbi:hypothetical protein N9H39_07065 [Gammaproteobacteria bacterium]|nr:hypothetical protein [Gammaproteobacteria bacterium]
MPRPRKPSNILELTGAKRRNRKRYANRGKTATDNRPVGRAPAHLTADQKQAWREIVKSAPPGVLQKSDRIAVESVAMLLTQIRAGDTQAAKVALLTMMLNKMGMTPTGRNSVSIPAPETKNPFADV